MIKLMVAALWISVATTGALVYAFQSKTGQSEGATEAEPTGFAGLDYVRTNVISVPVFEKGRVHGYFLARLVFTAETERLAQLRLPAEALLSDQIYTFLFGNPQIDFTSRDTLDVDAFRESIRAGINERLGEPFIHEVLIEQIDYLPKDTVGSSSLTDS